MKAHLLAMYVLFMLTVISCLPAVDVDQSPSQLQTASSEAWQSCLLQYSHALCHESCNGNQARKPVLGQITAS